MTVALAEQEPVDNSAYFKPTLSDSELKQQLFDKQVEEAATLSAEIAIKQERLAVLKERIMQYANKPGKYETASGLSVTVRKGSTRLDAKAFMQAYPPSQYADAYETKPLAAGKLIRKFGEDALRDCLTEGLPTLTINQ